MFLSAMKDAKRKNTQHQMAVHVKIITSNNTYQMGITGF